MLLEIIHFLCNQRPRYNPGISVVEMKCIRQEHCSKVFSSGIIGYIAVTRKPSLKHRRINQEDIFAHHSLVK